MIRGNMAPHARRRLRAWLFAVLAALPITAVLAATQYLYDDLGRLVLAANSDGSATVYSHDENGNVVTIINWAASGPVIAGFSPMYGHAGTPVTILGAGFSTTPANNTVTIGGAAAAVSSSTATTIVSSIPQSAITGPISVTVGGVTATSTQNITVYKPLISSFSPTLVAPGASVTVTGANLNLVSGTSLSVGGANVAVTSLSNTQAVFTAPNNTGGPITVNTSYGQTTSTTSLVIVPNAVGVANVVDHDSADPNGALQVLAINQQNKVALLSFQAAASSFYSVQIDALTLTPSGGSINYTVYGPTGASFASGSVSSTAPSILLPKTTAAGRYLVAFNSGSKTSVQITAKVELDAALAADGTSVPLSTSGVYQTKRFTFNSTAGDDLDFAITQLVMTPNPPNNVRIWVYRPDGSQMSVYYCYTTSIPGCSKDNNLNETALIDVQAGSYTVHVVPQGAATMTFNATLSTAIAGTLSTGATTTLDFNVVGRQALLTFTATANQTLALGFSTPSMTPAGTGLGYLVFQPNGSIVGSGTNLTTAGTLNLVNLPASGTYSVYVAPRDASTGSVQLTLAAGIAGTLTANGSTQNFATTLPQQNAYFTFAATAGDDLGLAITNLVITPTSPNYARIWVVKPSGYAMISGSNCYTTTSPGCSFNLIDVPETGTYKVTIESMGQQTMTANVTLSPAVATSPSLAAPLTVQLDAPGELALLPFTVSSGQPIAVNVTSGGTTPTGKQVQLAVYDPSGAIVQQTTLGSAAKFNLTNLSSGAYKLLISPADASLLEATVALSRTFTVWSDSTVPSTTAQADSSAVELGVKFKADYDGYIKGIRFYKGVGNNGTHVGNLWTSAGTLLATATFTNETTTGWQQVNFATPVSVTANTTYVASYFAPQGHYAYTGSFFSYAGLDSGPIHMPQSGTVGGNGVYLYSAQSAFPINTYSGGNYWVDVVYEFVDVSPPTVVVSAPKSGTTVANTTANITATFNESIDPATVSGATFELRTSGGATVSAVVTYDTATNTAILNPDATLASTTSYTATVKGGSSGLRDSAGNPLGADYVWTFTTALGPVYTVWPDTQVPSTPASTNTTAYELGVKFKVDTDGYVAGIRFYKGPGNGGTHIGNLWSASGTLLASATFTNETATGWQQVEFSTPVAITANTVYVVSYLCPQGRFAYAESFLANNGVDAGPIHLLKNGVSGANGLYAATSTSVFPTSTYASSYYWMDIVFVQNP